MTLSEVSGRCRKKAASRVYQLQITFNLGNGKDIHDISRCMELTEEEREYIDWLGVGQAIVSLKGRVQVPLHVGFPRVGVRKGIVGDDEIARTISTPVR